MDRRREQVLAEVKRRKDEKKKVLEEQLKLIQTEKSQVDKDVQVRFLLYIYLIKYTYMYIIKIITLDASSSKYTLV